MALALVSEVFSAQQNYITTVDCTIAELRECLTALRLLVGDIDAGDEKMMAIQSVKTAMEDRLSLAEQELHIFEDQMKGRAS